jgi:hypothetical protein
LYTLEQVSELLGVLPATLGERVAECRAKLSPECRRHRGHAFTDSDVLVLARALTDSEDSQTIVVRCAWCGRDMGVRPGQGVSGVSHGLCPDCSARLMEDYRRQLARQRATLTP